MCVCIPSKWQGRLPSGFAIQLLLLLGLAARNFSSIRDAL
jgi:hypothetical protein